MWHRLQPVIFEGSAAYGRPVAQTLVCEAFFSSPHVDALGHGLYNLYKPYLNRVVKRSNARRG